MKRTLLALAITSLLTGCAITQQDGLLEEMPIVTANTLQKEFDIIPAPASGKPLSVAVYSFRDMTGQRRPQANIASLSTAVTQGAESFLIKALQEVGGGEIEDMIK